MRSFPLILIMTTLGLSIWWGAVEQGAYSQVVLVLALSLVWAALTAESTERGLLHRRLWVTYALNPNSRLYRLLWGGATYTCIRAVMVAPIALLLFCQLLAQSWFEWMSMMTVTGLSVAIRHITYRRVEPMCSPLYSEYLARRTSVIAAAWILAPIFFSITLLSPHDDLSGVSFKEAISMTSKTAHLIPPPFDMITRIAESFENAYAWGVQVTVDEFGSILNVWLKWLLLGVFVLHKSLVAFAAARLISGVMTLGEIEQIKTKLNLIGVSVQANMHPQKQHIHS